LLDNSNFRLFATLPSNVTISVDIFANVISSQNDSNPDKGNDCKILAIHASAN